MKEMIRRTAFTGFIFGIIFLLLTLALKLPFFEGFLWFIPLATALLSAIGGIVADLVAGLLTARLLLSKKTIHIFSFLAAALVNIMIVGFVLNYFNYNLFHRDVIVSIFFGLAMGGIYGIYTLRLEYLQERMKFLEELAEKNQQLQATTRHLAISEERNRMGRELHDSISQGVQGLIFALHSLRHELKDPPERVANILHHLEATARSTLDELRALIEELTPSQLVEEALTASIQATCELLSQRQAIPVDVNITLPAPLSPEIEMTIYRIVQEALANIEKHAHAQQVMISITETAGQVLLTVKDDGRGFTVPQAAPGHGLRNMRQRSEEAGGSFEVLSKPGHGTTIKVILPPKD